MLAGMICNGRTIAQSLFYQRSSMWVFIEQRNQAALKGVSNIGWQILFQLVVQYVLSSHKQACFSFLYIFIEHVTDALKLE